MDNAKKLEINDEMLNKIKDMLAADLAKYHDMSTDNKSEMFSGYGQPSGMFDKEIVINVKASIYEKNEKEETSAPFKMIENNFFIPVKAEEDSDLALKAFMLKLNESLTAAAKEVSENNE